MRSHELAAAQQKENHTLAVLHFESRRVVNARRQLAEAEQREAEARQAHVNAVKAREELECPLLELTPSL